MVSWVTHCEKMGTGSKVCAVLWTQHPTHRPLGQVSIVMGGGMEEGGRRVFWRHGMDLGGNGGSSCSGWAGMAEQASESPICGYSVLNQLNEHIRTSPLSGTGTLHGIRKQVFLYLRRLPNCSNPTLDKVWACTSIK